MTKYIRKHKMIIDWTPDQIAECLNFSDDSIYQCLWKNLHNKYFWSQLSSSQKIAINEVAKQEWDRTQLLLKEMKLDAINY